MAKRESCRHGLPPLARGALPDRPPPQPLRRPTPAGAGSTDIITILLTSPRAYPRWRGEHRRPDLRGDHGLGLPPLARGARRPPYPLVRVAGPTPAGAGSTPLGSTSNARTLAYPRWRGEHPRIATAMSSCVGLPPLARGALLDPFGLGVVPRPTPAGAGSTTHSTATPPTTQAYPRWRGEHLAFAFLASLPSGLPPLARGARHADPEERRITGPTPAGAGSTSMRVRMATAMRAYPRWRGEHTWPVMALTCGRGLPPLARGAQSGVSPRAAGFRPTPAGAGSTEVSAGGQRALRAYPRWRGEHIGCGLALALVPGLPPLARGAPTATVGAPSS